MSELVSAPRSVLRRRCQVSGQEYCQVVTTTDAWEVADALARGAVESRVAACAQVAGPVASTYWWEGAVETAEEWQVVFKTTVASYPGLEEYIRAHHGYDVPEILCLPVTAGNPAYLAWVTAETGAQRPSRGAPGTWTG
jgi:periplasmic divalent cation tolerance protein